MKQYIKKALWIIPFVFSLNLSAATYYFRSGSTTKNFWTRSNWSTSATGTGLTGTSPTIASLLAANTWDLNGQTNVNMAGGTINSNFTLINGSLTTTASLTNTGTLTIYATSNPFTATNITFNFAATGSTIVMAQTAASQPIFPFTYNNLVIDDNSKVISTGSANAVVINGELSVKTVLSIQGSLTLGSDASMIGTTGISLAPVIELSTGGSITDGRTTSNKLFPVNFKHYLNSDVYEGTYNTLQILTNTSLGGNVTVINLLKIGNTNSVSCILDLKTYKITLKGVLDCPYNTTLLEYNRINASSGTFEYANTTATSSFDWDPEYFGSSTISATSSLVDVKNLIVSAANTSSLVTGINFLSNTTISGNMTINSGVSYLFDAELEVKNKLIIASDYPDWILPDASSTAHAIVLTGTNSELLIQSKQASITHDINVFKSNKLNKLTLDFSTGGEFVLNNNLEISDVLNLSSMSGNFLNLNNNTLTIYNITNTNGSSGGKFIGSSTSNLICSTGTSTLYFDQSSGESNRTLKNLTISNGADVSLGNWLNLTGGSTYGLLTVNSSSKCSTNNYLILKADADGYAQVANSAGTINGKMHVQTYFPSTAGRGYRFISSQVVDGTFYSLRDSGSVASGGPTYGAGKNRTANVGIQITGGTSNGFDVSTTNNPSAFYFDENSAGDIGLGSGTDGGWKAIGNVSATGDKLENGKGYRVLIRGDRTINLTGTPSNNIATTTQITGTYPSSPVQTTIYNSGKGKANNGINLVGNPFPANISWEAIRSANSSINLDGAYATYDVENGSYKVYSSTSGTGTATDDIAAGQGFLVYTSSSSATLTINEGCKNTNAKGDRYFKKQRSNHLVIKMSYDTLYSDKSIIYFLPGSTAAYDQYDAGHIQNSYVNLSSLDATNSQYALNCLDTLDSERTVPLSFKGTAPGDFSMTFEDCGTFQNNDIYLIDKFLNKKIKIDDWTKYNFSITSDPFTGEDGRLSLFFTPKESNSSNIIEKTTEFNIIPNPISDYFTINHKINGNIKFEYSIVNTGGQEVKSGIIQTNEKINTKDLARGIYFMTIKSQNESQTIKFIK